MAENPRIEELRRRVQSDPTSIAFAALAEEYRRTARHEEAIEICRMGLQRHPAYLSARVTLGRALIEVGDFEGARTELETVLQSAPENLAAIRGLAQIHERLGHSDEMHPDLAALAAQPLPVREPPIPMPAPQPTAAADIDPPGFHPQPLKIDLPDTAGGHTELEIDLPSPSAVHQKLDIDLPLEGGATDGFELDLPAGVDAATSTTNDEQRAATPEPQTPEPQTTDHGSRITDPGSRIADDAAVGRLEQFLVAVQHARENRRDRTLRG